MRGARTMASALCMVALSVSACSSGADPVTPITSPNTSPSAAPSPSRAEPSLSLAEITANEPAPSPVDGLLLTVTISADEVIPDLEAISLNPGEEMFIRVLSDRAGELHINAEPKQYFIFGIGTSQARFVIDSAGSVEIVERETGQVLTVVTVA
jgi:hypothetical protein